MGEAEAQEGARLANGGGHGRYAVSGRCQELGVVLVDEARGGQVGSDRVGGGDRFQASDVAALAGSPARRVDGNVRDVPGQASLADEGDAVDEVGTSDRGAGLDVDEGVDGSDPNKSAPVDGLADSSGPGVVVDDGGQAAVAGHFLGDVDAVPSGHAGRANDARALGVDGAGDCQGEATHAHAGRLLLARDFLHDGGKDRFGSARDVDKEAGGARHALGRVGEGDEAVVGSELDEGEGTDPVGGDEAAGPAPARGHRFVRL